jgi:DNA-binding transcriptional MocR family regulator
MSIPVRYWHGATGTEAIARAVERAVAEHAVAPGERLPTVRQLATRLGVSPTTVAAAYRRLAQRGIVTGHGRQGTRVSAGPALPARPPPTVPAGAVDLVHGNPDPRLLPDLRAVLRRLDVAPVGYGDTAADVAELVDGFVAELGADGVPARRAVIVSGALDAVERVLAAHLRPGDRVAVEDPGFPRVFDLVASLGLVAIPVALDGHGPRPAALRQALAAGAVAVVVTPRAQNPTGAALDAPRARELRRVLDRHPAALVIEDDHAGWVAGAAEHTVCGGERWAVVRSMSKSLGPDLRVAIVAGDAVTMARVRGRQAVGAGWVSHLLQDLVARVWGDRGCAARLDRAAASYAERRRALVDALAARGITAQGRSGLNVWIPVREEAATVAALAVRGWSVRAGERYRIRSAPAVRVTVAALDAAQAARLAADLAETQRPAGRTSAA